MLQITTAEQRLAAPSKVKMLVAGESGSGKTTLARTLDPESTIVLDAEAGALALGDWKGRTINFRDQATAMGKTGWEFTRDIACLVGGPDPSMAQNEYYSMAHFDAVQQQYGSRGEVLASVTTIFIDSITVLSRLCWKWAERQPDAFNKQGQPDTRGAYGALGREMIKMLTHIQHTPDMNVIFVGIAQQKESDYGLATWVLQAEGGKTGAELPGIIDQVMTLAVIDDGTNPPYRALVTKKDNPWGYTAKDRSGTLDMLEPPDLGHVLRKIEAANRKDLSPVTNLPAQGD